MARLREILLRLLFPPAVLTVILVPLSAFGLAAVFARGLEDHPAGWGIFGLSAYSLAIFLAGLTRLCLAGDRRLQKHSLYRRYRSDPDFRSAVGLRTSLVVTLAYCGLKAAAGYHYRSVWFGALAFYYLALFAARWALLRLRRAGEADRRRIWRGYRLCGWLLLALTAALGVVGFHAVRAGHSFRYPGHLIYAAALFTFYQVTMALVRLRRRGSGGPARSAGRLLSLASALVSLFFLQTAMLAAFGQGEAWEGQINLLSGSLVLALTAAMALYMIRSGSRQLQVLRRREP